MSDVVIYTADGCGHCAEAKESLKRNGIPFIEKSIIDNIDDISKIFDKLGYMTVPLICKENKCIVGNDEEKIKELLK